MDGRDGMLHAPITDLPSWHVSLNPGRKLLIAGGLQCGLGKAEQSEFKTQLVLGPAWGQPAD